MSGPSRAAVLCVASILLITALVVEVAARGGRGGGGGRGAAGRGGAGYNRGGPAARALFLQNLREAEMDRAEYDALGPAADGELGMEYDSAERREQRQERRDERQDRWADGEHDPAERRETLQDYVDDHYDDADDNDYGAYEDPGVYWTLPCTPNSVALGGVIYYVCGSTWYVRAYSEGEIVYTIVPNPTGH